MSSRNAERIRAAMKRDPEAVDLAPRSPHEALTRAKVDDLEREVGELRGRVDTLVWAVIGAVVVGVVTQLVGG